MSIQVVETDGGTIHYHDDGYVEYFPFDPHVWLTDLREMVRSLELNSIDFPHLPSDCRECLAQMTRCAQAKNERERDGR